MESQKTIKLYVYVDGINDVPFYGDVSGTYEEYILANGELYETSDGFVFNVRHTNEQIEIGAFRYDAKRMGAAPTISFTLMYEDCLDNFWSENVYATFNGEKYFLKQTPTSSLSNEDARYKHEVELVSERVALDNVYFFDAVKNSAENNDAVSNSATFAFFGNIVDFKNKLNASLRYADMQTVENGKVKGWEVVVDDGITSEEMFIPFDGVFFSNAIQESYNTFKIPYYFAGKEIHFGYTDNVIAKEFSYGVDDALLSITKTNANNKIVNRVTATGSSDNIPYYYPNKSSKGDVQAVEGEMSQLGVKILNYEAFVNKVEAGGTFTYQSEGLIVDKVKDIQGNSIVSGKPSLITTFTYKGGDTKYLMSVKSLVSGTVNLFLNPVLNITRYQTSDDTTGVPASGEVTVRIFKEGTLLAKSVVGDQGHTFSFELPYGNSTLEIRIAYKPEVTSSTNIFKGTEGLSWATDTENGWYYNGKEVQLKDYGLAISSTTPQMGDTITQVLGNYIKTSNVLLPPKYRETNGEERFYNATNDTYVDEQGNDIEFKNPFVEGHPKEHIINMEDIKPTIKGMEVNGLRIDMFSEFAYDEDDNDETYTDENGEVFFEHPYFFGKLRVMDFNLFDSANENQEMTISFTSGDCGACNFVIGATEDYPQMNPVQVYEESKFIEGVGYFKAGSLKRSAKDGRVICGLEGVEGQAVTTFQERQQDTSKYEVWIALRKEEETYGMLMPTKNIRPKACTSATADDGDTFVITGINLPQAYITKAEEKLEKEIIKYMYENNVEKFKFSIKFSRIYFEENPDVLELLNENSRIYIWYNGIRYTLYVNSISYYMESGGVLPDITVELDNELTLTQNAVQAAISQVRSEVGSALSNIDVATLGTPYFIRKDQDDEVQGRINFKKGIKFGEGGRVDLYDDNSAKLTIEYLEVTKKATFTNLEIQEKTHVGGQMLISPAAMNCGEVENILDEESGDVIAYRCYMQTKGQGGNEEIFNQFAVGDQAICQTFNAWGSKYYWRLVTAIGEDYIDLSVDDCDEGSDIPEAGDKIIQLGHRTDKTRQAAQVLSAHGETSPAFIMYNGINDYTLEGKEVTGILWNPATQEPQMYSYGNFFFGNREKDENGEFKKDFITFQPNPENPEEKKLFINADVQFGGGSKGLSDLSEWQDLQGEVDTAIKGVQKTVQEVQDQIDGVVENWNDYGAPLLSTEPTKSWVEKGDGELIAHINDTYINIEEYVDDVETPTAGQAWRWCQCTEDSVETESITLSGYIGAPSTRVNIGTLPLKLNYTGNVRVYKNDQLLGSISISALGNAGTINGLQIRTTTSGLVSIIDTTSNGANIGNIDVEFEYYDYIQVKDNEDNVLNLHWHKIADNDAVRALREAAEATRIAKESATPLNLLANSAELVYTYAASTSLYGRIYLPFTVNAGETYTFKCELAENLDTSDGVDTFSVGIAETNSGLGSIAQAHQFTFGKNLVCTFKINEGVSDAKADLFFWKTNAPRVAKARFVNLSLVKGSVAMPIWQDYQGDNGLKNILDIGREETLAGTGSYSHMQLFMSYPFKAGEQYTIMCEEATISSGDEYEILLYTQDNTGAVTGYYGQFVMKTGNYQYLTVTMPKDTPDSYIFGIYSGRIGAAQKTLKLTGLSMVKGTRPMMVWKENTDYLTNAFKNGSTKISGGLTMTQAVMVEDENGTVRGMLNGSNWATDSEHGRLIVAAGSEGATEPQLAKATTRIYEDGMIKSDSVNLSGVISAKQGNIGLQYFDDNNYVSFRNTPEVWSGVTNIVQEGAGLSVVTQNASVTEKLRFGVGGLPNVGGSWLITDKDGNTIHETLSNTYTEGGVIIEQTGCPNPALVIVKRNYTDSVAIECRQGHIRVNQGVFKGLRPNTRDSGTGIASGVTLTELDHNVFLASGTLKLPSSPILGQTYKIYHISTTTLTIDGNGKNIRQMRGTAFQEGTTAISSKIEVIELLWGGANWYGTLNRWD